MWKPLHGATLRESITCAENTAGIYNCHLSNQIMWRNEKTFKGTFEQRSTQWTQFPGRESKSVSLLPGRAGFGALCLHVCGVWTVICMSEESELQVDGKWRAVLQAGHRNHSSLNRSPGSFWSLPSSPFLSLSSFWPPSFPLFLCLLEAGSHHVRLTLKLLYSEEDFELLLLPLS